MEGEGETKRSPSTTGGGLWSSFHSSLAQLVRSPPATLQRHPESEASASECPGPAVSLPAELTACFTQLDLLIEYKLLCLNCPSGVYILPSSKSLYEWHGVLFVHSGPYRESIFRFTLYIPDRYPQQRPMVKFHSKVYHPYIHMENGIVNMTRVFPIWDPSKNHVWQVVKGTQDCFYNADTWVGCEPPSFMANAQMCALQSLRTLHITSEDSEDGNLIRFPEVDEDVYRFAKHLLLQGELPVKVQSSTPGVLGKVREIWDRIIS